MAQESRISTSIAAEKVVAVKEKVAGIRADLAPALTISLTAEERRSTLIMGDKTLTFVGKSLEFADQNPTLKPPYMDLAEAKIDFELANTLNEVLKDVNSLQRAIEDAIIVAGGEAYNAGLIFYASVKGASRANVPGSEAVYNELRKRFPGRTRTTKKETKPAEDQS